MKITRRQLRRIIKERVEENHVFDAELNLEAALGQLLDAHIDSEWNDTESAYPNDALPGHGIVNNAGAKVMKFAKDWWKQQKETEGLPREDWE